MCIGSTSLPPTAATARAPFTRNKSILKDSSSTACDASSSSSSSSLNASSVERSVSFHSVVINEFPMILGDNPDCAGIPVQIGWQPHNVEEFSLEVYEEMKPEPRKRLDLVLTPEMRQTIVAGTPKQEINSVLQQSTQIRRYRQYSVDCMNQDEWDYKMERLERNVKKVLSLKFLKSKTTKKASIRRASSPQ